MSTLLQETQLAANRRTKGGERSPWLQKKKKSQRAFFPPFSVFSRPDASPTRHFPRRAAWHFHFL